MAENSSPPPGTAGDPSAPDRPASNAGIIYVVVNPAMPGFVKIGTTTALGQRLRSLDNTNVPLPFECVIAREVDNAGEVEKLLHTTFSDKRTRRTREFFEVDPNQVIAALRLAPGKDVTPQETVAEDAEGLEALKKRPTLTFEALQIPVGEEIKFRELPGYEGEPLTARVAASTRVDFQGEQCAITTLTGDLLHQYGGWAKSHPTHHGPYWYYQDERLDDRRERLGV